LPGQAGQGPAGEVPVIHANAAEVSLDLVVHDRKNRPVVDLKPDQIAITDNGTPVTLTSLRLVSDGAGSEHLVTLLFDPLEPNTVKSARSIASKVLAMVPDAGFSVAVLHVEGRLRLQQGFTSDRNVLSQAVRSATELGTQGQASPFDQPERDLIGLVRNGADPSGKAVSAKDRMLSQTLLSALQESGRMVQDQHAQPSLAGLLALVQSQQQVGQRKAIIYFTHARQMDSHAREMLESIVGAANRTGISIYVIDLNALDRSTHEEYTANITAIGTIPGTVMRATTLQAAPPPGQVFTEDSRTVRNYDEHASDNSPIQNLAVSTGGNYINSEDSLRKPLQRMIQDMTTYYEASYVPAIHEYDGSFRSISIKPLRAGLNIRTSTGYFAMPPDAAATVRPFELPLLKILSEPQLPTDLAFHAAVLRLGDMAGKDGNALAIEAPLSDVEFREDTNTKLYSAHLSIVARIKDPSGTVLENFSEDIPRRGALEEVEKARSEAVTLQLHFTAPPGNYILEAVMLDHNSGKAGAQRVAFDIPPASAGPSLSDIVLVRGTAPFNAKTDPLEPLLHGNDKVMPNLSGQATRDAKDLSVFFVTHPDAHASEAAILNIQMLRDGEPVSHAPPTPQQAGGAGMATHLATFHINSLPDGVYEVKATLTQSGKTVESSVSFTLAGNSSGAGSIEPADANLSAPAIESRPTGAFAITFPAGPIRPPAPDEVKSILVDATQRAIGYSASLPNFICVEVTNRSVDSRGEGKWTHKDKFAELLTYRDNTEHRSMLEVNGQKSHAERDDLKGWMSQGEFGGVLNLVFRPSSKTDFHWKETSVLREGTVQVFDYRVARQNSDFNLKVANLMQVTVGYHGQIYVDTATRSVRRITMVGDDVPAKFPIHAIALSVDYDYIFINNHDYLLPIEGEVSLRQGRHEVILNQIEFRDYRRFGATAKILDFAPMANP
jgi:VWFA-related protein